MYSIEQMKKNARRTMKKHYVLLILLLVTAAMLGTDFSGMLDIFSIRRGSEITETTLGVIRCIVSGDIDGAVEAAAGNRTTISGESIKIGGLEIGHQAGVFADVVNLYSSGSFLAAVASAILSLTGSPSVTGIICAILALLFIAAEIVFVSEVYRVIYSRMIIEARIYERVDNSTAMYLFRTKKWIPASLAYLKCNVYRLLWDLTIVGGVIKHYSYAMVRYILAENPAMSGKEAITLSRHMMRGHKWQLFLLDLSFLGWDLLGIFTFGLLNIFFVAPYKECTKAEFYSFIRGLAKEAKLENADRLNDRYLFEKADIQLVDSAYADILSIMERPETVLPQPSKLRAFFQNVFGVVLRYDEHEQLYRKNMSQKAGVENYKSIVDGREYPARLSPLHVAEAHSTLEHTNYMRHYSVSTLILIFFSFCFVGWLWEVALYIVNEGVFVNRGVLHGPWLPVYGSGALLILMALNRFRKHPVVEFGLAIVLCGIVEYFSGWALEAMHDGQKWWDYEGYFLNLDGRICAEGLLVFGIAGVAAVYFLAPMLDNRFSKINKKIVRPLCIALLLIFIVDAVYSQFVPNAGEGITDQVQSSELSEDTKSSQKILALTIDEC